MPSNTHIWNICDLYFICMFLPFLLPNCWWETHDFLTLFLLNYLQNNYYYCLISLLFSYTLLHLILTEKLVWLPMQEVSMKTNTQIMYFAHYAVPSNRKVNFQEHSEIYLVSVGYFTHLYLCYSLKHHCALQFKCDWKNFSLVMYLSTVCSSSSHFPKLTGKTLEIFFFTYSFIQK